MQMHEKGPHSLPSCRPGTLGRLTASVAAVVLTVLVTVPVVTASAAASMRVRAGEPSWVTWTGGGVTFRHPASWKVQPEATGALVVFIDPAGGVPFRRNINLVLQAGSAPFTAAGYLETNLAEISQDHGTVSQQHAVSFDGTSGYRVVWAAKVNGSPYEFLSQWTLRHGKAWLFTYTSDPQRFGSALPTVKSLLASLKLPA